MKVYNFVYKLNYSGPLLIKMKKKKSQLWGYIHLPELGLISSSKDSVSADQLQWWVMFDQIHDTSLSSSKIHFAFVGAYKS